MLDEKDLKAIEMIITKSESMILDELARTQDYLDKKIQTVQNNIDKLNTYYRVDKLENDNTTLLLQMIRDMQSEMKVLKEKVEHLENIA